MRLKVLRQIRTRQLRFLSSLRRIVAFMRYADDIFAKPKRKANFRGTREKTDDFQELTVRNFAKTYG